LSKVPIFDQNFDFGPKFPFLTKVSIFTKVPIFGQKNFIFVQRSDF